MKKQLDNLKYDVRLQKYFVKSGGISESDLTSYISSLPDSEGGSKAVPVFSSLNKEELNGAGAQEETSAAMPTSSEGFGGQY